METLIEPVKSYVKVKVDNTSRLHELPVVFIPGEGYLMTHLKYLVKKRSKSKSWKDKEIQAIKLLIQFVTANKDCFETQQQMFEEFSNSLHTGTFNSEGEDESGLRWEAKETTLANSLIDHITKFSDFLFKESGGETELLNQYREATGAERILNLAAYYHRKTKAFLSHAFNDKKYRKENVSRNVRARKGLSAPQADESVCFPEDLISNLLWQGFIKRGTSPIDPIHERYKLAPLLITMLMHYGGIRQCEALHIYVEDIQKDPLGRIVIRIYHPIQGLAPEHYRNLTTSNKRATRKEYLMKQFGLEDRRTSTKKSYHAGWKDPALADNKHKFFFVYFCPTEIGELFYGLLSIYIRQQRVMRLENDSDTHPFLFTNQFGDPLSMKSFTEFHDTAVMKLGLKPMREDGLSGHPHRHAYKKRLEQLKTSAVLIKELMHHKSIISQESYGKATNTEIYDALSNAFPLSKQENHMVKKVSSELGVYDE